MKFDWLCVVVASVGMVVFAGTARGDLIHATTVTSSTADTDYYPASQASDGSTSALWCTDAPNGDASGPGYFANGMPSPVLTLDLGADYNLTSVAFWQYPNDGNATKTFTLQFSTDGTTWSSVTDSTTFTADTVLLSEQDFTLNGTATARYVKMTILSNGRTGGWGGDRVGVAEVDFVGTAIPEPTSFVLFGVGVLGLLAYAWRKRRQ